MKFKKSLLVGISVAALCTFGLASAQTEDWVQQSASGQDIAVGHDGQQWFVGKNGQAFRWDTKAGQWRPYGNRSDFVKIDAGAQGAIALTDSGLVYLTNGKGTWSNTNIRAADVGMGGGYIWLANARTNEGKRVTLKGSIAENGAVDWSPVEGVLERIDVDPQGRPWGVDASGKLFVYADGKWIEDTLAPKASDVGVGGDGSIYVVGLQVNEALGGGRVYQRDPNTGKWSTIPGRLSAISVTPEGKAVGVNSLSWVMAGNAAAIESRQPETPEEELKKLEPGELPKDVNSVKAAANVTLADILGTTVPGADQILLKDVEITEDTIKGTAELGGKPVRAYLHQPDPKETVVIAALEHGSIDLATYVKKIRNTDLGSFGLGNAVFFVQPDDAQAITYETLDDFPEALKTTLGTGEYAGLFPFTIHPGVTVVGTYLPADNNAASVMKAYGMDEKGHAVKGNFKLGQLQNLSFGERGKTQAPTKKEVCEEATSADLTGLDVSFPLPDYTPKFAEGAITFENTTFFLKEVEGHLEPGIVSGMTLKLPEAQAGISSIALAGKVSVRGDLNVLCSGINKETQGIIAIAGATTYNPAQIKDLSFEALVRLTDEGAGEAPTAAKLGWNNAFGLPFLNIRQYAMAGTFEQKEENGALQKTLDVSVWMNNELDRADIDVFGTAEFLINEQEGRLEPKDWLFESQGPIALNDLPGLKDMPKIDEFVLGDFSISPAEMTGQLQWPSEKLTADAYLGFEYENEKPSDFSIFARFNTLTPGLLTSKLPPIIRDADLGPVVIGWGNKDTSEVAYAELPENLQPLFDELLEEDAEITIANGLTIAGQTAPQKLFSNSVNKFTELVTIEGGIVLTGAWEKNAAGDLTGAATAKLAGFSIKKIPQSVITFKNAELKLSNIQGNLIEIESDADVKVPNTADPVSMSGEMRFLQESQTKQEISLKLTSDYQWNNPLKIPELQITSLGVEAEYSRDSNNEELALGYTGAGVFRKQAGEVGVSFAIEGGELETGVASFESTDGGFDVAEFLTLPKGAEKIANAKINTLLLSTNAVAADMKFNLNDFEFDGRGAIISDDGDAALFLRHDKTLKFSELIQAPIPLVNEMSIPKGVLIVSNKSVPSFDAGDIPDAIYDDVLGGLVEDEHAYSLLVEDGLTFLTKMNVDNIPSPTKDILKTPFGLKDEVFLAGSVGGVFGGDPSFGFYTILKGVTPSFPDFVKEFIAFKNSNLKVFVQTQGGANNALSIGVSADAKIKPRRLDDPTAVQELDGTFSFKHTVEQGGTAITASADVTGTWNDPMGLEGYALVNPSIEFGMEESGVAINVHTEKAIFEDGAQFVFDLDSTWVGFVPTDLAVQFAKTKDVESLRITPVTMMRLQKSIFDLVFRSGSKLKDAVLSGVAQAPTNGDAALKAAKDNAPKIINGMSGLLNQSGNTMFSLVEKSPLSMIGVENPIVYFGTPGSTPPNRPEVFCPELPEDPAEECNPRPPLGFGLNVTGNFYIDIADLEADLAYGQYKVNLVDGYLVKGKVRPPDPFAGNTLDVSGNMPLLGGPQHLAFSGRLEIPGSGLEALSGTFKAQHGSVVDKNASVEADFNIGGLISRTASAQINGTSLSFNSPGGCTDIPPFDVSMNGINLANFTIEAYSQALLKFLQPVGVPDPVECANDIAEKFKDIANGVADVVQDPTGNAQELAENAGELLTNPEEALNKAKNLAEMPLNTGEALAGTGIALVQMGVEKIPVLGPGAGKLIGDGFNAVKNLKNMAMNKLTNNKATEWLGAGLGFATNMGAAALGEAISAANDIASGDVPGMGNEVTIPPSHVNPVHCMPTRHYWNEVFKQCFEFNALVLFDEASRPADQMGDCIKIHHADGRLQTVDITVDKCFGNQQNQFVLDAQTGQIQSSSLVYDGYGAWASNGALYCMERQTDGSVKGKYCRREGSGDQFTRQQWNYGNDLKLESGGQCLTRAGDKSLAMGDCESANTWSGLAMAPNWNAVENVPARGVIGHKSSGLCMDWYNGGSGAGVIISTGRGAKFSLQECKADSRNNLIRLRVLNDNHEVEITGDVPFPYTDEYGCFAVEFNDGFNGGAKICNPFANENIKTKWQVRAVGQNNTLVPVDNIPLKDVLANHDFVFFNTIDKTCITAQKANASDTSIDPLATIKHCYENGNGVEEGMKFRGYSPDADIQLALEIAAFEAEYAFNLAREKVRQNLYKWQRYRIRAENARINEVQKMAGMFNSNIKTIQLNRKSPGHCKHDEYWNQTLKVCAKNNLMLLNYHNSAGEYQGCLQDYSLHTHETRIKANCSTSNEYDAVIDTYAFFFDEQGRILKKNNEYWANIQAYVDENGEQKRDRRENKLYLDAGNTKVENADSCLNILPNAKKVDGLTAVGFGGCGSSSISWRYSPQGELVSPDGKCIRHKTFQTEGIYNKENAKKHKELYDQAAADIEKNMKAARQADYDAVDAGVRALYESHPINMRDWHQINGVYRRERERLIKEYGLDVLDNEIKAAQRAEYNRLKEIYPHFVSETVDAFAMEDCSKDMMQAGKKRWVPTLGYDFSLEQNLPPTAKIKLAANDNMCLTGNMYINGDLTFTPCNENNKDQYFAFGGTDKTRFLISSRNSKTCVYDAGQGTLSHRPCRGSGAEMFMQADEDGNGNGKVKLINALSGQCIAQDGDQAVQGDCTEAPEFIFEEIETVEGIEFQPEGLLQPDETKTEQAQAVWNTMKTRAEYLYMGAYLKSGNAILQKGEDDSALMEPANETLELEKVLSHKSPQGAKVYIPAVTVPKTQMLTLPGFEDGSNHVTFAHARPVEFNDGPPRNHTSDPYEANFPDWYVWLHHQKVMRVTDDGSLKFEYIDESDDFRKSATFKMRPAASGEENMYTFESVSNPGQYLQAGNGALILGSGATPLHFESASKWFKSEDINLIKFEPPYREPKPPFKNWKFPDAEGSLLNTNY